MQIRLRCFAVNRFSILKLALFTADHRFPAIACRFLLPIPILACRIDRLIIHSGPQNPYTPMHGWAKMTSAAEGTCAVLPAIASRPMAGSSCTAQRFLSKDIHRRPLCNVQQCLCFRQLCYALLPCKAGPHRSAVAQQQDSIYRILHTKIISILIVASMLKPLSPAPFPTAI